MANRVPVDPTGAVSDVVGSSLLVGITVVMAVIMAGLLFAFPAPKSTPQTNLSVTVSPGNQAWNNGDEKLVVTNVGGDKLDQLTTAITYRINNGAMATVRGTALAFPGGKLAIGQSWTLCASGCNTIVAGFNLAATDIVAVNVVNSAGHSSILASASVVPAQVASGAACPFDTNPPAAAWVQSPSDITILTGSADVILTLTLSDDCAGVDTSQPPLSTSPPHLWAAITPAAPADRGAMTPVAGTTNRYTFTITAAAVGTWKLTGGQTLQYYASGVSDLASHSGTTATRTDPIDIRAGTPDYPINLVAVSPTGVTNPDKLGADDGVDARVTEGSGASSPQTLTADAVVTSSSWTSAANGLVDDSSYATSPTSNTGSIQYSIADPVAGIFGAPDTVAGSVVVNLKQKVASGATQDKWSAQACFDSVAPYTGTCNTANAALQGTSAESTLAWDITGLRPGGGAWTWADIQHLRITVARAATSGTHVYSLNWVNVQVRAFPQAMAQNIDWAALQNTGAGSVHYLEIEFTGVPADEGIVVNICPVPAGVPGTPCATRTTLAAGSGTQVFTYLLPPYTGTASPTEWSATGTTKVRVQIVDQTGTDLVRSSLTMDYARVWSAP